MDDFHFVSIITHKPTQGIPLALRARGTRFNARYNVNNFVDKIIKIKLQRKKLVIYLQRKTN